MPVPEPSVRPTPQPSFLRRLWRLSCIYWMSRDGGRGRLLLAGAIALEFGLVFGNVQLAQVQLQLGDALQQRDAALFARGALAFAGVATAIVLVAAYRVFIRQSLEMRWRRWLSDEYLSRWMSPDAFAQSELSSGEIDNPDQRIAEDIRNYVASALGLSLSLLAAVASFVSFAGLLWSLSGNWPIPIGGHEYRIPGFMMWVAIVYSIVGMAITHGVGRRLVPINFARLRVEADFRFQLMRFRENVEAVGFARGETLEHRNALDRFGAVVRNWWQLIRAQRDLNLTRESVGQLNGVVPLLVAAPGFFLGRLTLGNLVQAQFAYGQVSGALTWLVNAYQEIAQWRASIERLATFIESIEANQAKLASAERVQVTADGGLKLVDLRLDLPDGEPLLTCPSASIEPGERVVLVGPSGSGKTTLFRAIAGMWPFGRGTIVMPPSSKALFVPQRSYLPIGTLRAAATYPAEETAFSDEKVREAFDLLGLGHLAEHLDESAHWEQQLSGHEEQRLALVRALLHAPEWLFLDHATAALDDVMERQVYEVLARQLPRTAVLSVTSRPTVERYHTRRWTVRSTEAGPSLLEAA